MKYIPLSFRLIPSLAAFGYAACCFQIIAGAAEVVLAGKEGSARMQAARDEVGNVRSNIFLTLLELDRVRADRDPAHPQFVVFTNQLSRMEALARAFGKRAEEMKQRGNAYFADWEARTPTIQNAELRRQAEDRYSERKAAYDEISRFMQDARKHFLAFVEELTALQTMFLSGERDSKTIGRAQDSFMRANWRCIDVQRALMEIETRFERLAASFAKDLEQTK